MQDDIVDKIKKSGNWPTSRYKIDQELIEAGYDPAAIDAAWEQLNQKTEKSKRRSFFKFLKSPTLWLVLTNVGMILAIFSAYDFLPYYWLRLIRGFSLALIVVLMIAGGTLIWHFKDVIWKEVQLFMFWFWGTIFFFSICSLPGQSGWKLIEQLDTSKGTYYLIQRNYDFLMDYGAYVEIHKCQFASIWCSRLSDSKHVEVTVRYTKDLAIEVLTDIYNKEYGGKN
jgi:cation transport ATPase